MRRCNKCEITYKVDDRTYCVYCNDKLEPIIEGQVAESVELKGGEAIVSQIIRDRRIMGEGRIYYILGCYFRTRTLKFLYAFCRKEYKMGKKRKRFWIQPLNVSSWLILPWVVISFLDSIWIRVTLPYYCTKCGFKFGKTSSGKEHDPDECIYNKEYSVILHDVLNGQITWSEMEFKKMADIRRSLGKPSAYYDLCVTGKSKFWSFLDILCIWFSITSILTIIGYFAFRLISEILRGREYLMLELR